MVNFPIWRRVVAASFGRVRTGEWGGLVAAGLRAGVPYTGSSLLFWLLLRCVWLPLIQLLPPRNVREAR